MPTIRVSDIRIIVLDCATAGQRTWSWCWRRRGARHIAGHRVSRSRITVVALRFDERMIDKGIRCFQLAVRSAGRKITGAVRGVTSDGSSANGAEQVTWLWITESRFGREDRDRSIGLVIAFGKRSRNPCLLDNEDGRHTRIGKRAVLECRRSIWTRSHTYVVLLARRRGRVPSNSPSAIGRNRRKAVHLHFEHE